MPNIKTLPKNSRYRISIGIENFKTNDVEENGIPLGQMNAKLLQKIEELTLYTIEQEKQLKEQKEQLKYQGLIEKELQKQLVEQQKSLRSLLKRIEILEHE